VATSTYYPNSAGGDAWRGINATQPGANLAVWQDTHYSAAEKNTISTDDANYVRETGSGGNYPGHEVLYDATEAQGSITQLDFTVKVAAGGPTIYLYLWNFNTLAWDSKASQGGVGVRTITFTLNANITNYVDANGQWYLLVATPAVVNLDLYFESVVVTSSTAYTRTQSDTEGLSDTRSQVHAAIQALAETEGLTDAESQLGAFDQALSETEGLSDARAQAAVLQRTEADTEGLTDDSQSAARHFLTVYIAGELCEEFVVRRIRASYVAPWEAELFWPGRHDAEPPCGVRLWADVQIEEADGTIVFRGNVVTAQPGGVGEEGVVYTAADRRFRLENEPVRINNRSSYTWNRRGHVCEEGWGGEDSPGKDGGKWTAGEIILDILEHGLGLPIGGSDISGHHTDSTSITGAYLTSADIACYTAADILVLDSVIGEFSVDDTPVAQAISLLLALNGGFYGWYLDPTTGCLEVVDLDALPTVGMQAGVLGHWQDEAGTDYRLLENALEWSLDGVYSTVVIQGQDQTVEVRPGNIEGSGVPALSGGGEMELVNAPWHGWPAAYRARSQVYRFPTGKEIDGGNMFTPPAGYFGYSHGPRVYQGTDAGTKLVYEPTSLIHPRWMLPLGILGFYEAPALGAGEKLWGWYWAELPFTVTAGPDGDAYHWYGYARTRTIYDAAFRHTTTYPQPGTPDDEVAMGILAARLLRLFRDVRRQGTLRRDGVDFAACSLALRYNVTNLGAPFLLDPAGTTTTPEPPTTTQQGGFADPMLWASLRINAVDVTYDFEAEATEVRVANTFWMLEEYSALKQRLEENLFVQRELNLSEDIYECQVQGPAAQDPFISTNPTSITVECCEGESPPPFPLHIWNGAQSPTYGMSYTITDNAAWLSVQPAEGSSSGPKSISVHSVVFDAAALAIGVYVAEITITSGTATNSPVTVPVQLTVKWCATTTGGGGPTTAAPTTHAPTTPAPTTQPPTTTTTPHGTTTTQEPTTTTTDAPGCPDECSHCARTYYVFAEVKCGHFVQCQGEIMMLQDGTEEHWFCSWHPPTPVSPCMAEVYCTDDLWVLVVRHGPTGKSCIYWKQFATIHSCPDGLYHLWGGDCPDCPGTITVYT